MTAAVACPAALAKDAPATQPAGGSAAKADVKPPPQYTFKVEKDTAMPIIVSAKETGMLVDRFIFRKLP